MIIDNSSKKCLFTLSSLLPEVLVHSPNVCFCSRRFWNEFSVTSLTSLTCYHHGDRPLASASSIRRSDSSSVPCSALTRASSQMFVRQEKRLLRSIVCTLRNRSWHGRNSVQEFNARQIIMVFVFPYSDYLCISITNATNGSLIMV